MRSFKSCNVISLSLAPSPEQGNYLAGFLHDGSFLGEERPMDLQLASRFAYTKGPEGDE